MNADKKKFFSLLFLGIVIIFVSLLIPYRQALVFWDLETDTLIGFVPMDNAGTFKVKYRHSIHLSSVIESYHIANEKIVQHELEYEDFAIGMPADASKDELFVMEDGKYKIKNMKRAFPHFDMRVGLAGANHTLIYSGREYPLSNTIEEGTRVRVQMKKLNLFQILEGVNILDDK